ncbi:hypothetical protein L2E82_51743 [Cichorium intybus]|nr:hypothetical protein L2E82_51743 [Cichorium intybus]
MNHHTATILLYTATDHRHHPNNSCPFIHSNLHSFVSNFTRRSYIEKKERPGDLLAGTIISPEPPSSFNLLQQETTHFQACSVVLRSIFQFRNSAPSGTPLHHAFDQISLSLLLDFAWFTYFPTLASLSDLWNNFSICWTAIERSYEELKKAKPEKIMYLVTLLLENFILSSENNEDLIYCWKGLDRALTMLKTGDKDWALFAKSVLDRTRLSLSTKGESYHQLLQPMGGLLCNISRYYLQVSLVYANVSPDDILLKKLLDMLAATHPNLKVVGEGYISIDMALKGLPAPSEDTLILVCGPPGMIQHISGDKGKDRLQGEAQSAILIGFSIAKLTSHT